MEVLEKCVCMRGTVGRTFSNVLSFIFFYSQVNYGKKGIIASWFHKEENVIQRVGDILS